MSCMDIQKSAANLCVLYIHGKQVYGSVWYTQAMFTWDELSQVGEGAGYIYIYIYDHMTKSCLWVTVLYRFWTATWKRWLLGGCLSYWWLLDCLLILLWLVRIFHYYSILGGLNWQNNHCTKYIHYLLMFPISWIIDIDSASVSSTHTALIHTVGQNLTLLENVWSLLAGVCSLQLWTWTTPNLHFGHPSYRSWLRPWLERDLNSHLQEHQPAALPVELSSHWKLVHLYCSVSVLFQIFLHW